MGWQLRLETTLTIDGFGKNVAEFKTVKLAIASEQLKRLELPSEKRCAPWKIRVLMQRKRFIL